MTELCQINALAQKWHLAYFVPIDGHFDQWLGLQKIFGFWAQMFFGGLNQKSAMISKCKIHIYIDFERFRKIHGKM